MNLLEHNYNHMKSSNIQLKNILLRILLWHCFTILSLLLFISISWKISSHISHLYPVWYDLIGIDKTIEKFAPLNRHNKLDFEITSKETRLKIFNDIIKSINNQGDGLNNLQYLSANGKSIPFLTPAEIIHLNDVANLIQSLNIITAFIFIIWLCCLFGIVYSKIIKHTESYLSILAPPSFKAFFIHLLSFLSLCTITVYLINPIQFFYLLHHMVFPDNHQWFFYYQDSLMSTLMQAPNIFGYIAALIIIPATTLCFMFFYYISKWWRN